MTPREQEMLAQLRATYQVEAAEYLQSMGADLLAIEQAGPRGVEPQRLESIYRTAHSLKGASRSIAAKDVELVCQALESIFAAWKKGSLQPAPAMFDAVHRTLEFVASAVAGLQAGAPPSDAAAVRAHVSALEALLNGPSLRPLAAPAVPAPASPTAPAEPVAPIPPSPEEVVAPAAARENVPAARGDATVRVAVAKVDRVLRDAEEMLAIKHAAAERRGRLQEVRARISEWEREWGRLQGAKRTLQDFGRHAGSGAVAAATDEILNYLDWSAGRLRELEKLIVASEFSAGREGHSGAKLVNQLIEGTKQLLMLPVATLTDPLALQARQLGRDMGKEIQFIVTGADFEMDKRVLDELRDPLVHLVRNAVDHGIETPGERRTRGKPAAATLRLSVAAADGGRVRLTLEDDGGGIDLQRVKQAAIRHGALTVAQADALPAREAIELIFLSEVSTKPIVTDLSGRGLGLAIVREKIERLGGSVGVETRPGLGTTFQLLLPVNLAVLRGVVVEAARHLLLLPLGAVDRVMRVAPGGVQLVQERPVVRVGEHAVPLQPLAHLLGLAPAAGRDDVRRVVLLDVEGDRLALQVDEVLRAEEVLMKPLPPPLRHVRHVSGTATLASGVLVPVLNPFDLMRTARAASDRASGANSPATAAAETRTLSVLVADDSITSRTLLKGILESAGYDVQTAANGLDALEKLRAGRFDLVVSDVEMPRMNGFDLTARIRAERRLAEIPVVLVTALSSDDDRARGIEVGANAYLTKGDFDQTNLLEIVSRIA